ncbi:Equilibrative nucleoside transporter 3 [Sarcoptes scabiei]|uniref:Equilibrative nucleoside transporter 3 n=1 Tax=Sarcoptes scabiei TaxID=52283 RepID=A0A834VFS4_SARSC|nr:Equilibrative nucleoside transporter 3 [Sarcoptes scabiei]
MLSSKDAKQSKSVEDRWSLIKIIFFLHGISALLPWNMLINADSYFIDYKLNTTNDNDGRSIRMESYRNNFIPYLSIASKVPNILFQLFNLLFASSVRSFRIRMSVTFIVQIILFVLMIVLALIDSETWPETFFWITMITAVIFNIANGIFQSCIYAIASKFPMKYINYVTIGFSLSGTIASIFLIVSLLLSPHPKTVAIYYFASATLFMLMCFKFFRFYFVENNLDGIELDRIDEKDQHSKSVEKNQQQWQQYWMAFRKCSPQLINIILIYLISFIIFPSVQLSIKSNSDHSIVEQKFFAPIFCFLFFNTFATIGNFFAERVRWPKPSNLFYLVLLRIVWIPFFLFCRYLPERRKWPILIETDLTYAIGSALHAFTSGYTSSLAMMYSAKSVPSEQSTMAAMMASASVIIGIVIGVQCSMLMTILIEQPIF